MEEAPTMEEEMMKKKTMNLVFAVNGERFELPNVDPSMTLLEFLRTETHFKGPKLGCGEGGCGACVVLLSKQDPLREKTEHHTINSCLTLLHSINHRSITTTEGLSASKGGGFHSIHRRFAGFHATQCGFCTPGMCVSLFSALINSDNNLTASDAEKSVAGNLCRCTGYRPILDVCRSFASDVDIEDLGFNSFWRKGDTREAKVEALPVYDPDSVPAFPEEFLNGEISKYSELGDRWFLPTHIEEIYGLYNGGGGGGDGRVKLVVGNTSSGIYKNYERIDRYIDLRNVAELSEIKRDEIMIELGAVVTISKAIEALRGGRRASLVYAKIADHMNKVASQSVRNLASLGGNLVLAQRDRFPSDIATILVGAGAFVCIYDGFKRSYLALEEFLERPPCDHRTLLVSVRIPCEGSNDSKRVLFETYRAAPRPLGNALAYVNAAFYAEAKGVVLENLRLAFGAYGTEHAIRARKVEEFLVGKSLTASVLLEAIRMLREIIVPEKGTLHSDYRTSIAVGFLFEFLRPLVVGLEEAGEVLKIERADSLFSARQVVEFNGDHRPVGEPMKKVGAELQASGEAVYVDDIPSPKDCLHGAFIYSTKPLAHVKGIQFKSSPASQKILKVISFKDIPKGGRNIGIKHFFGDEPLFAEDITDHAGQPLALVIAETQKVANMVASEAVIDYDTEGLEPPILSVDDAVRRSSYFEIPPFGKTKPVGDFSKGMAEADHKILSAEITLGSQYFFYMETQTSLAVPDEDNCVVVYSSTQNPEMVQSTIARCLGIPVNGVRVITRRVGGGFGGKAFPSIKIATACALAAQTLQRPVRMYLDRKTDMIMIGGRHPMKVTYSVGFKSNGKITALHIDLLLNAGITEDLSPLIPVFILKSLKKYNWGALSFDARVCKTNLTSKTTMRAPGDVQGTYIAEAVIEHVASTLELSTDVVRRRNLHTYESLKLFYEDGAGELHEYTMPTIFDKLGESSRLEERVEMVKRFNACNRWRKRGISRVPVHYQVLVLAAPGKVGILNDGSIVVEVGGIELGQGIWTKVRQMTAYCLGKLWGDGGSELELTERVRVVQADTLSLIQGGVTSGSTTTEANCEAIRLACDALVERLKPLKERLEEQMGQVSWDVLIPQAYLQSVNLSSSTYWVPDSSSMKYLNYGAATSEVEIDLLTGAIEILRTDLIYDCGQSLNPAVDLGQIEGSFVQGLGFFMFEEYTTNSDGLVVSDGTWTYKIPTIDTIPKQFNVEIHNSSNHMKRILSSKASGEPPLLLAVSAHCAVREAIREARRDLASYGGGFEGSPTTFDLPVPATMPVIKELCGLKNIESYLEHLIHH
ncbi:Indole-3-acetaldehyde oxidase [Acorus gramineus]|uniref:Indole-3-acetaldehyde oxidase n=1 Tax=Acorus gramineus TaxID=55184 RepID=A0AAV9B7I5_ACOGR|nr:Indole-3-acetaldehyde oxidase [Acorus gramineus]